MDFYRLSVALSAPGEPMAHGLGQTVTIDPETGFEKTFGDRERVVKLGLTRKVAHTKVVEPIDWARAGWAGATVGADHNFDAELPSIHRASIVPRR